MQKSSWNLLFAALVLLALNSSHPSAQVHAADFKPKFGPENKPLATSLYASSDYFRNPENTAPQFWALISYYVPQFTRGSCSVASVAMTLNAARTRLKLSSEDKVVSQEDLVNTVTSVNWK